MSKVFMACVGKRDPYDRETGAEGPILSFFSRIKEYGAGLPPSPLRWDQAVDRIVLLSTSCGVAETVRDECTEEEAAKLETRLRGIGYQVEPSLSLDLEDPTNYSNVRAEMRRAFRQVLDQHPNDQYLVFISPGTPQMHVSWFLLFVDGFFPRETRLFQLREEGLYQLNEHAVREVKLV